MQGILTSRVGFRYLPKVAGTSVKHALYELEEGTPFDRDTAQKSIHDHFRHQGDGDLSGSDFSFIVVRDPVSRFLSAYANRVRHHNELSPEFVAQRHPELGPLPVYNPGIGQFIDHFEQFRQVAPIGHHTRSILDFLDGHDLDFFNRVYPLEKLGDLQRDLGDIYGTSVTLPHLQGRGFKVSLKDLGRSQLEWIIEHCRAEYDLLADLYTPEAVWQRWNSDEKQWVKKKRTS